MRKQKAISHFGGVLELARALKINRSAVYQWKDQVPPLRAAQLQALTGGALVFNPSHYDSYYKPPAGDRE